MFVMAGLSTAFPSTCPHEEKHGSDEAVTHLKVRASLNATASILSRLPASEPKNRLTCQERYDRGSLRVFH